MKIKLITVPIVDVATGEKIINDFTASKRILKIDRSLIQDKGSAFWCFCIEYLEGEKKDRLIKKPKKDYKSELTPEVYERFQKMRAIRKKLADETGNAPYLFFTDAELIEMAKIEHLTPEKMLTIKGVGEKKVANYSQYFIPKANNEKSQSSNSQGN